MSRWCYGCFDSTDCQVCPCRNRHYAVSFELAKVSIGWALWGFSRLFTSCVFSSSTLTDPSLLFYFSRDYDGKLMWWIRTKTILSNNYIVQDWIGWLDPGHCVFQQAAVSKSKTKTFSWASLLNVLYAHFSFSLSSFLLLCVPFPSPCPLSLIRSSDV